MVLVAVQEITNLTRCQKHNDFIEFEVSCCPSKSHPHRLRFGIVCCSTVICNLTPSHAVDDAYPFKMSAG